MKKRIAAFAELGRFLQSNDATLQTLIESSENYNGWFTPANIRRAVAGIANMLQTDALQTWQSQWASLAENTNPKKIGLILAGNIPLVGFHDVLAVLAAGHIALIKLSSQDPKLLPYILNQLIAIEPGFKDRLIYVERLENFDAVIATGSNNSSRYFEYYFSKVPHIIRKNRNSVAVICGDESQEELEALGSDIFDYFGLGCRNVSKIFIPKGYQIGTFFKAIQSYQNVAQHHKYLNNYDYNKSIYLVNGDQHLDNGFLLLKPDTGLASPLAVLYYEEYDNLKEFTAKLVAQSDNIQCVASMQALNTKNQVVPFGYTQQPRLWDYADGIDLMQFLCKSLDTIEGK